MTRWNIRHCRSACGQLMSWKCAFMTSPGSGLDATSKGARAIPHDRRWYIALFCQSIFHYDLWICKIQNNWCTVTVAPTIEHHGGNSRTPANQRSDQVPGAVIADLSCRSPHETCKKHRGTVRWTLPDEYLRNYGLWTKHLHTCQVLVCLGSDMTPIHNLSFNLHLLSELFSPFLINCYLMHSEQYCT